MRVLWSRPEATVGTVTEALADDGRNAAYTTVLTVLTRLHAKGLNHRHLVGRQYLYRAAMPPDDVVASHGRRAVDAVVDRYGTTALVRFAQRLESLDPQVRAELMRLAKSRPGEPDR